MDLVGKDYAGSPIPSSCGSFPSRYIADRVIGNQPRMNVFLVGIDVQTTDVRGVPSRLDQQFLCGCRLVCVESGVESRSR
jgi:hypothetical protein